MKDGSGVALAGVSLSTIPTSSTATSAADGTFTLTAVPLGSYAVVAAKTNYASYTLPNVGVAAGLTTSVSLALSVSATAPGSISGTVTDSKKPTATLLAGVVVKVEGTSVQATTATDGSFTLSGVPPGPVFLTATAPSTAYLDTDTQAALFVPAAGTLTNVKLVLSARPADAAQYLGMNTGLGCVTCHPTQAAAHVGSAHQRSLTRIARTPALTGPANAGAFARILNPTLNAPRVVMAPLTGTIAIAPTSNAVVGTGSAFTTDLAVGDTIGYTPVGLGWTVVGKVAAITDDTHLTLAANATFAPGVTSLSGSKYGSAAKSRTIAAPKMWPIDKDDIVAPAWPGVKATNPNYDANDPCIYNAPSTGTCAAGGTAKYADGQVNVYLCNLKGATVQGVTYANDEYVMKFGGAAYTCADGTFYDGVTAPAAPLAHIDVIYGGQGDKDSTGTPHANVGVFKQRFQMRLSDSKAADSWTYTAGKNLDSLTLPIQILESGDKVSGGFKMNGYHPTEQKFPGESWTQRTRTFSHACAGCHNTGLTIAWDQTSVTLPFPRDGATTNTMNFSAVKTYGFIDENISCEQCHGPGKDHATTNGGAGNAIINPKYLTAESQRQLCGKCHGYDDGQNSKPAQDYGFEFPWNSDNASKLGGGEFVAGAYKLPDFFSNWDERLVDDEAIWDPVATGGKLYGQAHRQQYIMLSQSKHTNNPYLKVTCTSCHDQHSQYLANSTVHSAANDTYAFAGAGFKNDVLCLTCHAGVGAATGPWALLSKDDIANVHVGAGGAVTKNGTAVAPASDAIFLSQQAVSQAVSQHMWDELKMVAVYNPLDATMPVGRCTTCHMPKVAKSGGYVTGSDPQGNKTIIEGDEASHTFDVIMPWQATALSRGGPTLQSGYYGQFYSATNVKYDLYGYMPNSCGSCHVWARKPAIACPDTTAVTPSYWPFIEHRTDPFWTTSCFTSQAAP